MLAKSIVHVIKKMQASWEERQEDIEVQEEFKALAILEFWKTQVEPIEKLHDSQVEAATQLHRSQIKLAYTSTKKVKSEPLNRYAENNELLIKKLKIMKNESNVLIFISLSKVPIIQKQSLSTEYNK